MRMTYSQWAALLMCGFFLFAACATQAASINVNSDGVAIKGYDTVAYFTEGRPIPGKKEYRYVWENATWLFSSEEHRKLFQENPVKYAPQYGGF